MNDFIKGWASVCLGSVAGAGLGAASFFAVEALTFQPAKAEVPPSSTPRTKTEFRLPPATPVTCTQPEYGKISLQIKDYADQFGRPYTREWNAKYSSLTLQLSNSCEKICFRLKPIRPGPGWHYSGQYGRNSECRDTWLKLVRKQGGRIFVDDYTTRRMGFSKQVPKPHYLRTTTIRCSTRDYWSEQNGWTPITPYTRADDAVTKFC